MRNEKGEDEHQISSKINRKIIKMIQKPEKVMKKKGWNVFIEKYVERRKCKTRNGWEEIAYERVEEMSGVEMLCVRSTFCLIFCVSTWVRKILEHIFNCQKGLHAAV